MKQAFLVGPRQIEIGDEGFTNKVLDLTEVQVKLSVSFRGCNIKTKVLKNSCFDVKRFKI